MDSLTFFSSFLIPFFFKQFFSKDIYSFQIDHPNPKKNNVFSNQLSG